MPVKPQPWNCRQMSSSSGLFTMLPALVYSHFKAAVGCADWSQRLQELSSLCCTINASSFQCICLWWCHGSRAPMRNSVHYKGNSVYITLQGLIATLLHHLLTFSSAIVPHLKFFNQVSQILSSLVLGGSCHLLAVLLIFSQHLSSRKGPSPLRVTW